MIDFLQTTEGVITVAAVYLLIGLGWNVVFNACGYLNLAIGEFYVLGAMFTYKLETSWGHIGSPLLAGLIAVPAVGLIGLVAERVLLRPLKDRGLPPLIVTIGIALILLQVANKISSATAVRPNLFISGGIAPGGVHIAYQELIVWGTATVVAVGMLLFFKRTDLGRSMRASVDNRQGAQALGLRVATFGTAAFAVGAMLAALAGVVVAPIQGVAYNSGDLIAIKAFMAVSIVGVGRNGAAVFGALLVAGVQGYVARYTSTDTADIVVLIAFLVVVYVYAVRSDGRRLVPIPARVRRRLAAAGIGQ